jgi:Fic family protein
MLFPPKYVLTNKISQFLAEIESCKEVIKSVSIPPELETNIRRKSTLKSSLFSARIEGNTLTLDDINLNPSKDQQKNEVFSLLKAITFLNNRGLSKDLNEKDILQLHKLVLEGLEEKNELGHFRSGPEAIFNSAGMAIYIAPRPAQIHSLIQKLIKFTNSPKEPYTPVKAVLAHYIFEKIHPFVEGNGRVGRLLMQAVLSKGGYGMKGLTSVEEYLDQNRTGYYQALEAVERDVTDYIEFMLEAIATAANEAKLQVLEKEQADAADFLLPRRAEILNIIKDQRLVSFDQIRRMFLAVNKRTLRYDLKKLADAGFIRKRGATKGVYYEVISK